MIRLASPLWSAVIMTLDCVVDLQMKIVMGVAVIMVILIIFLLICFGGGRSCVKKRNKTAAASPTPAAPAAPTPAAPAVPAPDASASSTGRRLLMDLLNGVPMML